MGGRPLGLGTKLRQEAQFVLKVAVMISAVALVSQWVPKVYCLIETTGISFSNNIHDPVVYHLTETNSFSFNEVHIIV
jgi:hypothetical protein